MAKPPRHWVQAVDYPQPPLVSAGLRQTVTVGPPVAFAGAFTDLNPADTHTVSWDFGDGSRASGVLTPRHTYTQAGTYRATLTVAENTGFTG